MFGLSSSGLGLGLHFMLHESPLSGATQTTQGVKPPSRSCLYLIRSDSHSSSAPISSDSSRSTIQYHHNHAVLSLPLSRSRRNWLRVRGIILSLSFTVPGARLQSSLQETAKKDGRSASPVYAPTNFTSPSSSLSGRQHHDRKRLKSLQPLFSQKTFDQIHTLRPAFGLSLVLPPSQPPTRLPVLSLPHLPNKTTSNRNPLRALSTSVRYYDYSSRLRR